MDAPILRVVVQRHTMDCGVACLAMICGVSYENALVAIAQDQPNVCSVGIWFTELRRAAKRLGFKLKAKRRVDLAEDTGILNLSSSKWRSDHVVVLREGLIVETDGTLWEPDVFLRHHEAKVGTILVAEAM
jgi:ABC-type bacteriocin/lantibiotic exporter with double-glycine peptidase domain